MHKAKTVSMPLAVHFKLNTMQSPASEKEKVKMKSVPYSSPVGSLMDDIICTGLDIAYAVSIVTCKSVLNEP